MNVTEILLAAQSSDHARRSEAEQVLKQAEESNFQGYLVTLADQLSGEENVAESRRLAGLIMKNTVDAKDRTRRVQLAERWKNQVDQPSKTHVRQALLRTLASLAPEARRAAAQVISKIAAIDLTTPGEWDSLITDLLESSRSPTSKDDLRQASLETLGYICEEAGYGDLAEHVLAGHSNNILTAVIHGMTYTGSGANGTEESATAVRLAATHALNNTLEFARAQFDVDRERAAIMTTICEAARSGNDRVRQAAFEGLVKIGENYYDKLHEYIRLLYELTENAIRKDTEPVALQAIEFWSTIAEEEIAIMEDAEAKRETGEAPDRESKNFVASALPYLKGPIFDSLKKQEDDPLDDETWNSATAAGSCLELLAQAAPDLILGLVMPFVQENITDVANWRSREAAILAIGSVLDGPPLENVKALVRDAIVVLIQTLVHDPHMAVRDTTAWTLARVILVDRATTLTHLANLVQCLRETLTTSESPVIAAHVCYAIHNLAECFLDEAERETGALRDHVEILLAALLMAADRDDAGEGHLRVMAYEALNAMFRSVSKDAIVFIGTCVPLLLEKLETTIRAAPRALNEDDVSELLEVQGLLCGALTTATNRLDLAMLEPYADRMMEGYLQVFRLGGSAVVLEEALLAVGAVADTTGKGFSRYMQHFMPVLAQALSNLEHYQVCSIAVTVVGDICRALGQDVVDYSDNVVYLLLEALRSPTLDRSVKPPILSCFGDVAMAVKGQFEKYLRQVMECMQEAAEASVMMIFSPDDYDTQDWLLALRESIFEAYIGIINGLRDENKQDLLMPCVEWLVAFCEAVLGLTGPQLGYSETDLLIKPVAGVLGDLVDAIPQLRGDIRQRVWVFNVLEVGGRSNDARTRETTTWARQIIFE